MIVTVDINTDMLLSLPYVTLTLAAVVVVVVAALLPCRVCKHSVYTVCQTMKYNNAKAIPRYYDSTGKYTIIQ